MTINEEVHNIYNECKMLDQKYKGFDATKYIEAIESDEERRFAVHICNFFLAERQKELVRKGIF